MSTPSRKGTARSGGSRVGAWATPSDNDAEGRFVPPNDRILLSVAEAAARLGIGRSLMYELLGAGLIESIHIGRLHKVPVAALGSFVAKQRER